MRIRHGLLATTVLTAIGMSSMPAYAQTAPQAAEQTGAENSSVDEIVVTARRRAEDIQKVPLAVAVVTGEALSERVVTRSQELARLTPGLEVNTDRATQRSAGNFAIRGQSGSPFAGGSGVGVYFAEVPTIFNVDLTDLENVQVLKGPQGTLFGRVTTGGAVLLTPKAPSDEFEGDITARYGQYGTRLLSFGVGGPIFNDVLSFRVAGQMRASDGFTRNLAFNKKVDGYDSDTFRLSLRFTPTDTLQNDTVVNVRTWKESNGSRQLEIVQPFGSVNANGVASGTIRPIPASVAAASGVACPGGVCPTWLSIARQQQQAEQQLGKGFVFDSSNVDPPTQRDTVFINTTRFDLSDNITLKNIVSYGTMEILSDGDTGSDATSLPIHEGYQPAGSIINTSFGDHIVTEEIQAQGDFMDGRLQLTGGGYFESTWSENFGRTLSGLYAGFGSSVQTPGAGAPAAQVTAYNACLSHTYSEVNSGYCHDYTGQTIVISKPFNRDYAAYAQGEFKVTDDLRLTAGIRQTWSERKSTSGRLTATANGITNPGSSTILGGIATYPVTIANNPIAFAFPAASDTLPGASLLTQSVKFDQVTWMVAADYDLSDNLFVYGTVRTGYKAGGFNASGVPAAFAEFGPETITDYELGVKGNWRLGGITGRTSLDFFWDDYQDIQRTILVNVGAGTGTTTVTTNAASATIRGLELDTTVRFNEWLDVHAFYALTDAKYNEWRNTGQFISNGVPATADLTQNMLSDTSKHRWAIQPTVHVVSVPETFGRLDVSANVYFQGEHAVNDLNSVFAPSNIVKGATKADVRIDLKGVDEGPLSLAAGVTNVTDVRNKIGTVNLLTFEGIAVEQWAEPRMWYVEASYRF